MSDQSKEHTGGARAPADVRTESFGLSDYESQGYDERDPLYALYQRAMLELAFGRPLPSEELQMWGQLDPERRTAAVIRLGRMLQWDADLKNGVKPDVVATASRLKISPNRLYRMRRDWSRKKSLSSLGVFAGSPARRAGKFVKAFPILSKSAADLLAENPRLPVEQVVENVRRKNAKIAASIPKQSTLRTVVQEQRRQMPPAQVGRLLTLDCTAILTVDQASGSLHKVFVVMDGDSGLIFGAALGTPEESRNAFARAATAALIRMSSMEAPWAATTDSCLLAFGLDAGAWRLLMDSWKSSGTQFVALPRYGQIIGKAVGSRLGRIVLRPAWTGRSDLPRIRGRLPVLPSGEMMTLLDLELDRHNAAILGRATSRSEGLPERFVGLLHAIAEVE